MPVLANRFRQQILKANEEPGWINESLDGLAASFEGWSSREHDELGRHERLTFQTLQGREGPAVRALSGTLTTNVSSTSVTDTSENTARRYTVEAGLAQRVGDSIRVVASGDLEASSETRIIRVRFNENILLEMQPAVNRTRWFVDVAIASVNAKEAQGVGFGATSRATAAGGIYVADPIPISDGTIDFTRQITVKLGLSTQISAYVTVEYFRVSFIAA